MQSTPWQFAAQAVPPVTVGTYAAGNNVGGLVSLPIGNGEGGVIQSVVVHDKNANNLQLDVVFFNANPTASTITDKTNVTIAAADLGKIIGVAHVGDFTGYATGGSTAQAQNLGIPFKVDGNAVFAAIIARGAVVYATVGDITITVGGNN